MLIMMKQMEEQMGGLRGWMDVCAEGLTSPTGPSCPCSHWRRPGRPSLDACLQESPAGWRSLGDGAAPWRCRDGRGRSQSWLSPSGGSGLLPWPHQSRRPACCGWPGLRRAPHAGWVTSDGRTPAADWCHCSTCCTFSKPSGGSSLP